MRGHAGAAGIAGILRGHEPGYRRGQWHLDRAQRLLQHSHRRYRNVPERNISMPWARPPLMNVGMFTKSKPRRPAFFTPSPVTPILPSLDDHGASGIVASQHRTTAKPEPWAQMTGTIAAGGLVSFGEVFLNGTMFRCVSLFPFVRQRILHPHKFSFECNIILLSE